MAINNNVGLNRREFLRILGGASIATAGITGAGCTTNIQAPQQGNLDTFQREFNDLNSTHFSGSRKGNKWVGLVDGYTDEKQQQCLALVIPDLIVSTASPSDALKLKVQEIKIPDEVIDDKNFRRTISLINKNDPSKAWEILSQQVSSIKTRCLKTGGFLRTEVDLNKLTDEDKEFLAKASKLARAMVA